MTLILLMTQISAVQAATNPTLKHQVDCQSADKTVEVGFVSDPANPSAGPEIIAFRLVLQLIPSVSTTVSDLKNVDVVFNNASYSKLIEAENKVEEEATLVKVTVAGGFTNNEGLKDVDDLILLKNIGDKTYRIKVLDGEMYEKGNTNNIFNVPSDFYSVDPASCQASSTTTSGTSSTSGSSSSQATQQTITIDNLAYSPQALSVPVGTQVVWSNNDSTPHTVTSPNGTPLNSGTLSPGRNYRYTFTQPGTYTYTCTIHPSMTGTITVTGSGTAASTNTASNTNTGSTTSNTSQSTTTSSTTDTIDLSVDKANPSAGETVVVTATIQNRGTNSIDWTQTAGAQIQPQIANEEQSDGSTKSTLTFDMPAESSDIVIAIKVGSETDNITIPGTILRGAAEPTEGIQDGSSIQERLAARRAEQQAQAGANEGNETQTAGNIHSAAGGLTNSGPTETALFVLVSVILAFGWRKLQGSEV